MRLRVKGLNESEITVRELSEQVRIRLNVEGINEDKLRI
jgi:hypothetical protein